MKHKLRIRNMVCSHCVQALGQLLASLGLPVESIALGEVQLSQAPSPQQLAALRQGLPALGFQLIEEPEAALTEQIKHTLIAWVRSGDAEALRQNTSTLLSQALGQPYAYLSQLFSSQHGITIERYTTLLKIERAKELMVYNELPLKEIAHQLGYSSAQYLSTRFHQVTGMSPSQFRQLGGRRQGLNELG